MPIPYRPSSMYRPLTKSRAVPDTNPNRTGTGACVGITPCAGTGAPAVSLRHLRFWRTGVAGCRAVTPFAAVVALLMLTTILSGQTQPTEAPSTFRIAGTIVSTDGHPLSRARVALQDVKNRRAEIFLITGDDGRFEFDNLPAGKFALMGAKRGYISASYEEHEQFSTAIVTGSDFDTTNLTLRLAPNASLTGHVLDEFGDPVRNATVALWRDDHSTGISRTQRFRNDTTDDQGLFEFAPLDPGTYFVSASAAPWYALHQPVSHQQGLPEPPTSFDRSLDVVYLPTYYSGATEIDDASPILLRGGDRLELDLHLTPAPAVRVTLRIAEPSGGRGFTFPMLIKRDIDGDEQQVNRGLQQMGPGVFEMSVPPGKYELRLQKPDGQANVTEVEINQNTQELDTSPAQAASGITAKVLLPGENSLPERTVIALRNSQGRVVQGQRATADQEISFPNLVPGKYEVLAGSRGRALYVGHMSVNGTRVSGHFLDLPPNTTLDVTLSLLGGSAEVNGFAQRVGKGVAGAMIVLVPRNPEENRELFRRDQSDLDGSFTFHSVIPGSYTVIAIENGWDLDWSKPAVLSRYTNHGEKLVIPSGSQTTIQLPQPIAIQPK